MMMKLQQYSFNKTCKKGKFMHLAGILSRAALPHPVPAKVTVFEVELNFCSKTKSVMDVLLKQLKGNCKLK